MRILYIHGTLVPPPRTPETDRFALLSETLEGDVLQPVWHTTPEEVEAEFGPGSYPVFRRGRFEYHWWLYYKYAPRFRKLAVFWFYLKTGWRLHRQKRYDCIVAYSHMTTAVIGAVLKLLTGARLIPEIVTSPQLNRLTDRPRPTFAERLGKLYSDLCLYISVLASDRIHFLFPDQLRCYGLLRRKAASVFHEFVPISSIKRRHEEDPPERYILFVGAPWYLKGVDLLIQAFRNLSPDFPDVRLKLLGNFPEYRPDLDELIANHARIDVLKPRPNPEVLEIMRRAMILVLPSRCEGLPRVLIEGMATGIPVIASDVGGIPYLVRDGTDGFVVAGANPAGLEARLRQLLSDPELRQRLGASGHERARKELNERVYVQEFTAMIEAACGRKATHRAGGLE